MWKIAGIAFTIAFLAGGLLTEILRVAVHRRRLMRDGVGGSQDIALVGSIATIGCGVMAGISWTIWFLTR